MRMCFRSWTFLRSAKSWTRFTSHDAQPRQGPNQAFARRAPSFMTGLFKSRSVLPGFGLSLGFTVAYLGLIVLIPLSAAFLKVAGMSWHDFVSAVATPRVLAAYRISFGASLAAAAVNMVFGLIVAWVLVRYPFPGRKIIDALVDLPFALPTGVAGIPLRALSSRNGGMGGWLMPLGLE